MKIQIAPMTVETVPGVAEIEKECFSSPWSEQAFFEELASPNAVTLVALYSTVVAGFINARKILGAVYINNVAVCEKFRRTGIGRRLLDALEKTCEPYDFVTLEVRKTNGAAQSLYEKCGYTVVGERKKFYTSPTEDAVLMTKYPGYTE